MKANQRVPWPLVLAAVAPLSAVVSGCSRPVAETLLDEAMVVQAGKLQGVMFSVDTAKMKHVVVEGSFTARGGPDDAVTAMIMEEADYLAWRNQLRGNAIYTAAQKPGGTFRVPIRRSGRYYLVFANHLSVFMDRKIRAHAVLRYDKVLL